METRKNKRQPRRGLHLRHLILIAVLGVAAYVFYGLYTSDYKEDLVNYENATHSITSQMNETGSYIPVSAVDSSFLSDRLITVYSPETLSNYQKATELEKSLLAVEELLEVAFSSSIHAEDKKDIYIQQHLTGNHIEAIRTAVKRLPEGPRKRYYETFQSIAAIQFSLLQEASTAKKAFLSGEISREEAIIAVSKVKNPEKKAALSDGLDIQSGLSIDSFVVQTQTDKARHDEKKAILNKQVEDRKKEVDRMKKELETLPSASSSTPTASVTTPSSSEPTVWTPSNQQ